MSGAGQALGTELASRLYRGRIDHTRFAPFYRRFAVRVFSLYLDLDEIGALASRVSIFSHNRWNVLSFHDRDHGARDGSPLRPWIERHLGDAGIDIANGPVRVLCFPRLWGFVFNPLSIWFCHKPDGALAAVLYEVHNTYGDAHTYLVPIDSEDSPNRVMRHHCDKVLHVSPFLDHALRYRFQLLSPGRRFALRMFVEGDDGPQLMARHMAAGEPITTGTTVRAVVRHPLLTFKVVLAMHWQAMQLWVGGLKIRRRPAPPVGPVTVVHAARSSQHGPSQSAAA